MNHIKGERFDTNLWIYFFVTIINRLDHATSKEKMSGWLKKRLYSDFPTAEYAKYQAGYAFYPDFKCAEFCQFLYNISVCKGFILKPAEKSTCAPTSLMVAHSRAG